MTGSSISGNWSPPPEGGNAANLQLSNILPTGPVDFNGQRIVNVGNPVNPQDLVTLDYFDNNPPSGVAAVDLSNILPVAAVDFNSQRLVNVANPVNPQDALTLDYFDNNPPAGIANVALSNIVPTADVDFNGQKLVDVADPTNPQDVVTLAYFNAFLPSDAANRTLSNLNAPTEINTNLVFADGGFREIQTSPSGGAGSSFRLLTLPHTVGAGGNITVLTGSVSGTLASGTGTINIQTGNNAGGAGSAAPTGTITLVTGQVNNGGETGSTGSLFIRSGNNLSTSVLDLSGAINISSGEAHGFASGNINITSGNGSNTASSGNLQLQTGLSASSFTGNITLATGGASTNSGGLSLQTGVGGNDTGNISLLTGAAGGVQGEISFNARQINYNSVPNVDHVWQSGVTASRPSGVLGKTYFDTTLGIPIWYNGAAWVDATGTPV